MRFDASTQRAARVSKWFAHRSLTVAARLLLVASAVSCQQYRVEHHKRPAFYQRAISGELPDQVTLDDGTVIKYEPVEATSTLGRKTEDGRKSFEIREESEAPDGTKLITLRAMLPEHVLVNTLTCLRNEEYALLYEQMLGERARERHEQEGGGVEEFSASLRKNRHDLVATLTRMVAGLPHEEVAIVSNGDGVIRCRLRPQIAQPFKFTTVDVVKEGTAMKLLRIE